MTHAVHVRRLCMVAFMAALLGGCAEEASTEPDALGARVSGDAEGEPRGKEGGAGKGGGSGGSPSDPPASDAAIDAAIGSDAGVASDGSPPTPPPPPSGCGATPPTATPVLGTAFYFSDCQAGATSGCVAGDNANAGTSAAAPKRNLSGLDVNALAAGTQLLFARGGAWTNFNVVLENANATATSPIVFDSYPPSWGGTARPWLKAGGMFYAFQFGRWQSPLDDGGYIVRNVKVDGLGVGSGNDWAFWLRDVVHDVTLDNVEITGFKIGIHSGGSSIRSVTIRNSNVHHNSDMGMLGRADDLLIEGNVFANNNFSGSGFNHAIYLGGHGERAVLRNNTFTNNSTVNGVCTGGNVTVHGQWDGLLLDGNTISQDASSGGCYGFSITTGYATAEWFRNVVVRGNTIVNLGNCSVCANAAPGIVVENNVIVNTQTSYHAGILIPTGEGEAGDVADTGAIIRNNTIYLTRANAGEGIGLRAGSGSNQQVVSNLIYLGAGVSTNTSCFSHTALSNFTAFGNNLCHHAGSGPWSPTHATLASAQTAGFDLGGLSTPPMFVAVPTSANRYEAQVQATSPAVNAGHPTRSSAMDRACRTRTDADIGAFER